MRDAIAELAQCGPVVLFALQGKGLRDKEVIPLYAFELLFAKSNKPVRRRLSRTDVH